MPRITKTTGPDADEPKGQAARKIRAREAFTLEQEVAGAAPQKTRVPRRAGVKRTGDDPASPRDALLAMFPAEKIAATLDRLLHAKVQVTRGRGEDAEVVETDDHKIQLDAVKLLLAYRDGRKAEPREIPGTPAPAEEEDGAMASRLEHSPALRSQLRRMLEQAEGGK